MYIILSPAKKQEFANPAPTTDHSLPLCPDATKLLLKELRQYTPKQLQTLMKISPKLAELNTQRFQDFDENHFGLDNAKQALFAFQGDAYRSLNPEDLSKKDWKYAQKHLGILSGFYGLIRPLDLIQAYRLEMKTPLSNPCGANLYDFWQKTLVKLLNQQIKKSRCHTLINLASQEYQRAIDTSQLQVPMITIDFKEYKDGSYKTIGIYAKRARGLMARHLITQQAKTIETLKQFNESGYGFNSSLSTDTTICFSRRQS